MIVWAGSYIPGNFAGKLVGTAFWIVIYARWYARFLKREDKTLTAIQYVGWKKFLSVLLVLAVCALALTGLPQIWAFEASRANLEHFIREHKGKMLSEGKSADARFPWNLPRYYVGILPVYAYDTDDLGDSYFVTGQTEEASNTVTSGIAHLLKPIPPNSPYGPLETDLFELGNSWYMFTAVLHRTK